MRRVIAAMSGVAFVVAGVAVAPSASAAPYTPDPNSYEPRQTEVGAGPRGIATFGFEGAVASSDANTATIFNTCSRFGCEPWMIYAVGAGLQPMDVAVGDGPQTHRVYVTNPTLGALTVIPYRSGYLDPNLQPAIVPIGGEPTGVALSPDSVWAYVADKATDSLIFVDAPTLSVVQSVPVGADPWGVAASPDGRYVYVVSTAGGVVSVLSTTTRTLVATIPVGHSPGEVAIDPSGAFAYVTNNADDTVSLIDTATWKVVATIPVGNQPWGVGATATHAFVANFGSGTVSVVDTARREVVATIRTGVNPFGVAIVGHQQRAGVQLRVQHRVGHPPECCGAVSRVVVREEGTSDQRSGWRQSGSCVFHRCQEGVGE